MVAKVHALGRSFAGVAKYCLHDAREPDEHNESSGERGAGRVGRDPYP